MTTALYRRYRPETFQDVIGQEHVTEPLMTALRKNRVHHAYLFSGPRGCGKTTSARILARCLNCTEGPTATPCGHCDSCRDLARDGAGSLDVIEMDAASHGGVDHARDLRERATFAPVRDRYKIFIIDEAHMVTREGFNALLKIVEEPPEHVKFIFATTEPSKVLTTIRSRTHHYPFRLVPPEPLMHYLERLCDQEGVGTEPGVLSLVVRAGGGSVRDSLSVLDQLMAGSDDGGITYDLSVALLGYTHAALLDDVVDAFAAGDAATVFAAVDRVIQTGQDPRRFVEDLLERFRDLVVVNAVPDSAANILHGMPTDQINRLRNQAAQLGAAELSRAADITNTALNEMTGATSPQLHLELLCARILLPSADDTTRGVTARVDRLERRLSIPRGAGIRPGASEAPQSSADDAAPALPPSSPVRAPAPETAEPAQDRPVERIAEPTDPQDGTEEPEGTDHPAASAPVPHAESLADHGRPPADGRTGRGEPAPARDPEAPLRAADEAVPLAPTADQRATRQQDTEQRGGEQRVPEQHEWQAGAEQSHSGDIELLRSSWTEIVAALAEIRRVAWTVIMRGTPVAFDGQTLRIAFEAEGDLLNFPRFENDVRAAIQQVLGLDCRVEAVRPGDVQGRSSGGQDSSGPRSGGRGDGRRPSSPEGRGNGWDQHEAAPRGNPEPPSPSREPGMPGTPAGSGPRRSAGEGSRAPQSVVPEDDRPEYFREPEGFGANRRRPPEPQAGRPDHPRRETAPGPRDARWNDRRGEPAPSPEPDEPVTSWSVVKIPQGAPETSPDHDAAHASSAPDDAPGTGPAIPPGDDEQYRRSGEGQDARPSGPGAEKSATPGPDPDRTAHRSGREGDTGREQTAPADAGRSSDSPAAGGRSSGSRGEYWSPPEPPPHPEDEPPADLYETSESRPGFSGAGHPNASRGSLTTASPTAQATARRTRPSWRERHAAELAAAQRQQPGEHQAHGAAAADEDFVPSADDESIEDSALHGRAAIERLLGGILIDERPHNPDQ